MNLRTYSRIRILVAFFISVLVSISTVRNSYLLAAAGVATGMLFLILVRKKIKIIKDERQIAVSEKAAKVAYAIFTPTLGLVTFLLMVPAKSGLGVFAKGDFLYIESLGNIFAYLTLFLIALYAVSYHFINKKYGGIADEE